MERFNYAIDNTLIQKQLLITICQPITCMIVITVYKYYNVYKIGNEKDKLIDYNNKFNKFKVYLSYTL